MVMVEIQDEAALSGASHEISLEDLLIGYPWEGEPVGYQLQMEL